MDQPQNNPKPAPKGDLFTGFIAFALLFGLMLSISKSTHLEAELERRTQELVQAREDRDAYRRRYDQLDADVWRCRYSVESLGLRAEALTARLNACSARLDVCRSRCYTHSP